jgi:hypothetical protein
MKSMLLSTFLVLGTSATFAQQHNCLISNSNAKSVSIRDVEVSDDLSLICGLDFVKKKKLLGGVAQVNENGSISWAKSIDFEGMDRTYTYDVAQRANGNFYVHGLTKEELLQYAFVLEFDPSGQLVNSFYFNLGETYFWAINKMEVQENGDLIFFFSHYGGTSIAKTTADGGLLWGKTVSRRIVGTGKQAGYDFRVMEDGSIIGCGKNEMHFSVIKLSENGKLLWDKNIELGSYSQAKAIEVLPTGNVVVSGDYLPENGRFTSFLMELDGEYGTPNWSKKLDQFDGSFHYQQLAWVKNELHLSLMGNNDPSKMDPDFHNYYVRLDIDGEVIRAYRNGDKYQLADYQRLIREDNYTIVYGSVYTENRTVEGMIHTYNSHELDMCYWTELDVTTSFLKEYAGTTEGIYSIEDFTLSEKLPLLLVNEQLKTEATCRPVMGESTENEELIAAEAPAGQEKSILEYNEFTIYPNPNDGLFTIKTSYQTVDATVYDLTGKVVYEGRLEDGDRIDLRGQPKGVYMMSIVTESEKITRRIVIN